MPSVMITGVGGYVGAHLAGAAMKDGWDVTGVDNWSWGCRDRVPEGVRVITSDILSHDLDRYDLVIHCAAFASERLSRSEPDLTWRTNVTGTTRVVRSCQRTGSRLVHISTGAIEATPPSPYSRSKAAAELCVQTLLPEASIIRLWCLYGPGQLPHGSWRSVFAIWAKSTMERGSITVFGGEQTRGFTHLPDLDLWARCRDAEPGRLLRLSNPAQVSLHAAAASWRRLTGAAVHFAHPDPHEPQAMGEDCDVDVCWTSLDEGLANYWRWYREHGQTLPEVQFADSEWPRD